MGGDRTRGEHSQCVLYQAKHFVPKECHPRCVYQNYNRLIINNGSQKHNYICKYNNLPAGPSGRAV